MTEVDDGQATSNLFIIAKRHMKADLPITPEIMNQVLNFEVINQGHLDLFASLVPKTFSYPATSEDLVKIRDLYGSKRVKGDDRSPGSYIIRREGSLYVGGALHVNARPFEHLKPSSSGKCAK